MKQKSRTHNLEFGLLCRLSIISFVCVLCSVLLYLPVSHARVYIDITSPTVRKLPISITSSGTEDAQIIEKVLKSDLYFTGIFTEVDPDIPGAEIRVHIEAMRSKGLKVAISVSDMIVGKKILKKKYEASGKIVRALAHSISNDIFKVVTGRDGVFRTKIAYIMNSSGKKELHLMDWDGHGSRRIVSSRLVSSHSWSDDGAYIAYSSAKNRKWGIYLLDLKRYSKRTLFLSEGLNLVGDLSGKNRMLFSSSRDGSPEIFVMDTERMRSKKLTRSYGIDVSPVFSPDASRIAFVSDRGGTPQIYTMNADGRGLRRLTFEGNYNTSPAWSPDGKWIAYSGRKYGKNQIFMIKSDGTVKRQLTERGNNEEPTFSPNGLFIAFDSDRTGRRGIYLMRANGEGQKRITPKSITARAPKWAPYKK